MHWLDATLPSPAKNLALDEALLDFAESSDDFESLRFWESSAHFVVLGYANRVSTEVNQAACERLGVPILRRCSGGGTILQGPGVLNYTLVLRIPAHTPLANITGANQFIMQRNADALTQLLSAEPGTRSAAFKVEVQGHTDLAIAGRKFSGNAQRRKRTHLLFHGAILLDLDLDLLDEVLPLPSLQPGYRAGRSHREFLTQLPFPASVVKRALSQAWSATEPVSLDSLVEDWRGRVEKLVAGKYSRPEWNSRV